MPQSSQTTEREIERLTIERDELAAAAKRVSVQLQHFLNDATDPGTEALAAQYELSRILSLLSIDTSAVDEAQYLSRFSAIPSEIHGFLANRLPEDVHLNYQRAIGNRAVEEAAKDLRMEANAASSEGVQPHLTAGWLKAADHIDPIKGGGHFPSVLIQFGGAA
ncbi:hypothetical protein ABZT43_03980 [Streptomyces sp. NPDC005349]|uniref:hypothetical protein n=1 Tax=Streptomyces sp. NPDC005349 TaxID=3157037 RepID=UPI0033B3047A